MQTALEQLSAGKLHVFKDVFDADVFPVNETGMRLWTLVVFGGLLQNVISATIIHDPSIDDVSGSQFAMSIILVGVFVHCSYNVLSYWSGATWNWGGLWVYFVLVGAQFLYSYINTNPTVGDFSITTSSSPLSKSQQAMIISVLVVVAVYFLLNLYNIALAGNRARLYAWFNDPRKRGRVIWLAAVIAALAVHTLPKNNGPHQLWHFHHALCGWFLFCVAVLCGTPSRLRLAQQCIACERLPKCKLRKQLCDLVCECSNNNNCTPLTLCCKCGRPNAPCTRCKSEVTDLKDPGWTYDYIKKLWTVTDDGVLRRKNPVPSLMNVVNQTMAVIVLAIMINGAVTYGVNDFELIGKTEGGQPTAHWRRGCIGTFSALFPVLWLESRWRKRKPTRVGPDEGHVEISSVDLPRVRPLPKPGQGDFIPRGKFPSPRSRSPKSPPTKSTPQGGLSLHF